MLKNIFSFYINSFKNLKLGKTLLLIVFIKLFIIFFILKLFFFPDFLKTKFNNDKERSDYVSKQLIKK